MGWGENEWARHHNKVLSVKKHLWEAQEVAVDLYDDSGGRLDYDECHALEETIRRAIVQLNTILGRCVHNDLEYEEEEYW